MLGRKGHKCVLLLAIGLAQQALDTIAIDGMMEFPLGDGKEKLWQDGSWDGFLTRCPLNGYGLEDDPKRKDGKGVPFSVEKPVNGCLTAQPFGFGKSVAA